MLDAVAPGALRIGPGGSGLNHHGCTQGGFPMRCPELGDSAAFQMFYSGSNPIADCRRSLGLGLSLCRSIVNIHGGSITVSDNQPTGTVFIFTIPMIVESRNTGAPWISSSQIPAGCPPQRTSRNPGCLTPTEWLQTSYPEHYPTQADLKDLYTKAFIEEYLRLQPTSADDFNERRSDKSRGWRCVARYHHLGTWTNLIKHLGLPKYSDAKSRRVPSKVTATVHNDYDFRD